MRDAVGPPEVVLLLPSLAMGGSERQVVALAQDLARNGIRTEVICLRGGGPLAGELAREGVPVELLGYRQKVPLAAVPTLARRWLRRRPRVVYAWLMGLDALAALPARLARVPRVLGSRRETASWMQARHRIVQALGTLLCDRVVCVSERIRGDALERERGFPDRFAVARNGVDLKLFQRRAWVRARARRTLGLEPSDVAVLTVASLGPEKGHADLLDAVAALGGAAADARLLWAGEGPLGAELRRHIDARGLAGRIRMLGQRDDVPELLAGADLFVLPSRAEGLPNALLEAMAASLPVIATEVGGVAELVEPGRSGLLVAPGDRAAMAAAIVSLCADPALRRALGLGARMRVVAEFGLDQALARHRRLVLGDEA